MPEDQIGKQGDRIGVPDRDKYWAEEIRRDLKTLKEEEFTTKWGKRFADQEAMRDTDPLTGLQTIRGLWNRLGYEIPRARKNNQNLAYLMFDLDGLKKINDTMGHDEGNRAIVTMADFLRGSKKESAVLARFGGDEFAMICPDTDVEQAKIIAGKIIFNLKYYMRKKGFAVTSSVGLAILDPHDENSSVTKTLKQADSALYQAKDGGRNQVVVYVPEQKAA